MILNCTMGGGGREACNFPVGGFCFEWRVESFQDDVFTFFPCHHAVAAGPRGSHARVLIGKNDSIIGGSALSYSHSLGKYMPSPLLLLLLLCPPEEIWHNSRSTCNS